MNAHVWILGSIVSIFSSFGALKAAEVVFNPDVGLNGSPMLLTLISKHSGRCVDISSLSKEDGAKAQQWACSGGGNQAFWLTAAGRSTYSLKAKHSSRCLDVTDRSTANGAVIQQWSCHGGENQLVRVLMVDATTFKIQFVNSGKCLDVTSASLKNGAVLYQQTCSAADSQQWHFKG